MKKLFAAVMVFVMILSVLPAGIITAWAENTYTVYFDDDSFEVTVSPASKTVTLGSTYGTLPIPSGSGYSFEGWYTGRSGAGTRILSSTTVTKTASHTLYAKWHWGDYPLNSGGFSYVPASGGTAQIVGTSGPSGGQVTIPSTIGGYTVTSIGYYNFGGLIDYYPFSNPTPATVIFPSTITSIGSDSFFMIDTPMTLCFLGNAPSSMAYPPLGSTVYYLAGKTGFTTPTWMGCPCYPFNGVNITFDANGGTGIIGSTLMVPGLMLSAPAVTKTGYTVTGWSPELPATVPDADTTYTAQWTAKTFTVTFNPQDGTVTPSSSTVAYGSTYGTGTGGFPTPVRAGYTFGGWFTSTNGAGTQIFSTTIAARTSSQTLYAKWTANQYTVTFDANGGAGGTSGSMSYGTALTAPVVTKPGYVFTGWSQTVPETVGAEDALFTAQWNMLGDIGSDNTINALDALIALRASSGTTPLTDIQKLFADVSKDGKVNSLDALMILKYTSGKISSFE